MQLVQWCTHVMMHFFHPKQDLKRSNMAVKLRHGHHEVWMCLVFATFCLQVIIPFIVQVHWHPMRLTRVLQYMKRSDIRAWWVPNRVIVTIKHMFKKFQLCKVLKTF